jgi:hypothetical protein
MSNEAIFNIDSMETAVQIARHLEKYSELDGLIHYAGMCGDSAYMCTEPGLIYQPTGNMIPAMDDFNNPIMVEEVLPLPGRWGRLRVLNQEAFDSFIGGIKAYIEQEELDVTIYLYDATLGAWTSDGVTPAPDYVPNIALIA